MNSKLIGIDIAKNVFQVLEVAEHGKKVWASRTAQPGLLTSIIFG